MELNAPVVVDPAIAAVAVTPPAEPAKPAEPAAVVVTPPVVDPNKPAEAPKPGEAPKPAEAAKPAVAPETYEFKPPEGVSFDATLTDKISTVGKKYGLSQDAMNELVGLSGDISQKIGAAQTEAITKTRNEWTEQSKTDKEFGGEHFAQNLAIANGVLDTFATPSFKQLLVDSGLSQHPDMIRVLLRVGKEFSPDRFVPGTKPAGGAPKSIEDRLYPNHKAA